MWHSREAEDSHCEKHSQLDGHKGNWAIHIRVRSDDVRCQRVDFPAVYNYRRQAICFIDKTDRTLARTHDSESPQGVQKTKHSRG